MTYARFFDYKFCIYKLNITKFLTSTETTAAHKLYKFQKYRLKESPMRGEKVAKISNVLVFPTGNSHIWADWGQ